jgi:hypothetical protein
LPQSKPSQRVALDGVDILLFLVGLVSSKRRWRKHELLSDTEIQTDRLGMADVQVAVRLRRKAGDDGRVPAGIQVRLDDVADEVLPGLALDLFVCAHARILLPLHAGRSRPVPMWQILAAAPRRPQRDVVHDPSITAVIPALIAGIHHAARLRSLRMAGYRTSPGMTPRSFRPSSS